MGERLRKITLRLSDVDETAAAERAAAADGLARMPWFRRQLVDDYRAMCRQAAPARWAPGRVDNAMHCPVCGEKSAVLSWTDVGGPTVAIYCTNHDGCGARDMGVTIRSGFPIESEAEREQAAPLPPRRYQAIWRRLWMVRHGGVLHCNACGISEHAATIEMDHIVPVARGGADADWNIQPLCTDCHKAKTKAQRSTVG